MEPPELLDQRQAATRLYLATQSPEKFASILRVFSVIFWLWGRYAIEVLRLHPDSQCL